MLILLFYRGTFLFRNIKRSTTLNGESTPVKRQRLVNLSSNSQSSVKTENPTSASIYPVSKLALRG